MKVRKDSNSLKSALGYELDQNTRVETETNQWSLLLKYGFDFVNNTIH